MSWIYEFLFQKFCCFLGLRRHLPYGILIYTHLPAPSLHLTLDYHLFFLLFCITVSFCPYHHASFCASKLTNIG